MTKSFQLPQWDSSSPSTWAARARLSFQLPQWDSLPGAAGPGLDEDLFQLPQWDSGHPLRLQLPALSFNSLNGIRVEAADVQDVKLSFQLPQWDSVLSLKIPNWQS